jgi:hypothetical protein
MPSSRHTRKLIHAVLACACLAVLAVAGSASAQSGAASPRTGGAVFVPPPPPPKKARIVNGLVVVPAGAPARIRRVIEYGNRIIGKPYRYGGGHKPYQGRSASLLDSGYDCSGTVSYALFCGRFRRSPLPSGPMMGWGRSGPGRWLTVYAHSGHAYMVVAGLRLDTSMRDDPTRTGPGWSKRLRRSAAFVARHPRGY